MFSFNLSKCLWANIIITMSYRNIFCYSRFGGKYIIQLYGILSCCAGKTDVRYAVQNSGSSFGGTVALEIESLSSSVLQVCLLQCILMF